MNCDRCQDRGERVITLEAGLYRVVWCDCEIGRRKREACYGMDEE